MLHTQKYVTEKRGKKEKCDLSSLITFSAVWSHEGTSHGNNLDMQASDHPFWTVHFQIWTIFYWYRTTATITLSFCRKTLSLRSYPILQNLKSGVAVSHSQIALECLTLACWEFWWVLWLSCMYCLFQIPANSLMIFKTEMSWFSSFWDVFGGRLTLYCCY